MYYTIWTMEALVRTDEGAVAVWSNDVFDILRGKQKI
jgi:hypothetical protein